jgi:hypothetical protein
MTSYINDFRLVRVWKVTSRAAGDGNIEKKFYDVGHGATISIYSIGRVACQCMEINSCAQSAIAIRKFLSYYSLQF